MQTEKDLATYVKRSAFAKSIKRILWARLGVVLLLGGITVMGMPALDRAVTGADQPGFISFVGTGLIISLLTIYILTASLQEHLANNETIILYAVFYNVLIVLVKFTLGAASLYKANPVLESGGFSFSDFNGNPLLIAIMGFGVFVLYWLVFTILKKITINGINKRFNVKSKAIRAKIRWFPFVLFIGLAIFTGGFLIFLPLIVVGSSISYLGYIFSTAYGLLIALALAAAVACAAAMFAETERQAVLQRNLSLVVVVVWTGLGLLVVYHILWAVYLFVLTTIWPFRVVTSK